MKSKKYILMLIFIILIHGCSSSSEMLMNTLKEQDKNSDNPYAWDIKETDKAYIARKIKIKGEIIKDSSVPKMSLLESNIFKFVENSCGYKPSDRIQIRKLSYEPKLFKEIWVYKDDKSAMEDKTTALTIIMKVHQNGLYTDINLEGDCPAKGVASYTSIK